VDPDRQQRDRELRLEHQVATLQQAVLARDEFIAMLGHELRNPLSPIYLQVQVLLEQIRRHRGEPIEASWLEPKVELLAKRLARFLERLNHLLDISRATVDRIELELETVDLASVVRELVNSFDRELTVSESPLIFVANEPVMGAWDRLRLEQIVGNLISNAIRYGSGKPIEVRVESDERAARIVVRDHGIGIADSDQQRIFERFERAVPRPRVGSFGIGLWLVRKLCSAMGGTVSVASRVGEGAEFTVALPRRRDAR
jgi:signal transduction histidine kinase